MSLDLIGDLIDKLSIINIKIWDATGKAHEVYKKKNHKKANELFSQIESMNMQRKEYISAINNFFSKKIDHLNKKSFEDTAHSLENIV